MSHAIDQHRRYLARTHLRVKRRWPLEGVCENCGAEGPTELAFLWAPAPHTEDRNDYEELCHDCHVRADKDDKPLRLKLQRWLYRRISVKGHAWI